MDHKVIWKPQPGSQTAYLTCPVFEVLYGGNRGGGKTDSFLMDFAQHVGQGFGAEWRGIIFRRTYPELADIITKTKKWFPQIWPGATYNHTEHYWKWPTGEMLLFRQFFRDEDYWDYHGSSFPFIGWEELCTWPSLGGYKRMMSLCRSSLPGMPRKYRATANPYGPGHNVVKHRWDLAGIPRIGASPVIRGRVDAEGNPEEARVYIHSDLMENKILLAAEPNYLNRLRQAARNPSELQAWVYGNWDVVSGGMFDDVWDANIHVVQPFEIPSSWQVDRSFDWGSAKPFSVGWWATSDGSDYLSRSGRWRSTVPGDLFRIDEWYGWNGQPNEGLLMLNTEIARGIIQREVNNNIRVTTRMGIADGAIFNLATGSGSTVADDMAKEVVLDDGKRYPGTLWNKADKSPGSRKMGWEQTRTRMKGSIPRPGLPRESPGLFVFEHCQQFIRTVPVLPRSLKNPDDVDTETEDHIADEMRYRVLYAQASVGEASSSGYY